MSVAKAAMPASALRFLAVAAANTLIYSGYALLWVASACCVFILVGRRALGECSAVLSAATTVGLYAVLGCVSLLPLSLTLVAARSMASVPNNTHAKERTKETAVKRPHQILLKSLREMLQDTATVGLVASFPFLLLMGAGAFVMDTSPVKESRRERIGSLLMDLGKLGGNTVNLFITIPSAVRRTWRMKY